jgi:hypothetical protein
MGELIGARSIAPRATVVKLAGGAMLRAPRFMALFIRDHSGGFRLRRKTYGKVFRKNQYLWLAVDFPWEHWGFRAARSVRAKLCARVFRPALCARDGNMGRRGSARPTLK